MSTTPLERAITGYLARTTCKAQVERAKHIVDVILPEHLAQPTFELHDAIKGYQMLVMTMDDGTQQHLKIHSDWWVKGSPRPTSPGVYRHSKEPTTIYTLYSDGLWRSNRNFNGPIAERYIPDGLIKIA